MSQERHRQGGHSQFRRWFRGFLARGALWPLDSVRIEAREVENRPAGCPRFNLRTKRN
jgi:hypothetical protein